MLVCVPPGFVGYMFEEFQLHFGISRPPHLSRLGGAKTNPKYLHRYEKRATHILTATECPTHAALRTLNVPDTMSQASTAQCAALSSINTDRLPCRVCLTRCGRICGDIYVILYYNFVSPPLLTINHSLSIWNRANRNLCVQFP